jgi:hypothetical protein
MAENGFDEYKKLLLAEISNLKVEVTSLTQTIGNLRVDVAMLQVKSGVWGFMAGLLPVLALLAMQYLKK